MPTAHWPVWDRSWATAHASVPRTARQPCTMPLCVSPACCAQDPDHLFVVGSEDGRLRKCSTAYGSRALLAYEGHAGPVYAVHWNARHPAAFLSASADWTVKLWHADRARVRAARSAGCALPDRVGLMCHMQPRPVPAASCAAVHACAEWGP